jgi:chromosome segregation ATPase
LSFIDWESCEEKPTKSQKVEGRFLLDLRSKINDLERQLREKSLNFEEIKKEFEKAAAKAKELKSKIESKDEKISSLLNQLEANDLTIQDLEQELSNSRIQIRTLEKDFSSKLDENMDLKQKISNFEKKLNLPEKMEYLINRLNKIMEHKGFVSEKELEDIVNGKKIYDFS